MFEQLKDYKKIGWDFDDTLVGHEKSALMWEFIAENPYGQEHHIVTFRSGGMEKTVFLELEQWGAPLLESHFVGFHSVPHKIWVESNQVSGLVIDISNDPYVIWKGAACAEHGLEVLIDDMTHQVIHGCRKHGIVHIHPDDLR